VFVEKGFDAARVDEVAAAADVNKRMIYVYFRDKEGLYLEVLKTTLARAVRESAGDGEDAATPEAAMADGIRRYFRFLGANPDSVRLLAWETLNDGRRAGAALAQAGEGFEILQHVVVRGMESGAFRRDLDPRKIVISISNLCMGYFTRRGLLRALWGSEMAGDEGPEAMLEHIVQLVLHGIRKA